VGMRRTWVGAVAADGVPSACPGLAGNAHRFPVALFHLLITVLSHPRLPVF